MPRTVLLTLTLLGIALLAGGAAEPMRPMGTKPPKAEAKSLEKAASSRIVKVTVYPDSALVTREVDVPAGTGLMELVVTSLPPQVINSSLYSEGSDGNRILTTRFRSQPVKEDTREDVRKAEDEVKKLKQNGDKIQAEISCFDKNMAMLAKLEEFTAATTRAATEKATLNGETIITLSKYVMEQRAEKSKDLVALKQQLEANQEQMEFVRRHLQSLAVGSSRVERDAIIGIDKTNAAPAKLRLNYLVGSVTWRPQYKLRAGKDKDTIAVEYLAAVMQQTGEDWSNVDLTLSTAQPLLNADAPELKMLEVSVVARAAMPPGQAGGVGGPFANPQAKGGYERQAMQLRSQAQTELRNTNRDVANKLLNDAAAFDQTKELVQTVEEIRDNVKRGNRAGGAANEGPSVTYHLKNRLSVPSRNDEQVLEVTKLAMAPEYFYKAVPVINKHVYRQANLTNKSEFVLLPGEATMYQGTDFVGRMSLPLVAIGEQFIVGFGVDPQLQIQRVMMDKAKETKGGNQVLRYDYRILVSSYKTEDVKLQVWDRLPHAESETAGILLVKSSPEISKDGLYVREEKTKNLLRWDLDIKPTMNGENALAINYQFTLELDRNMLFNTFSTK